MVNKGVSVETNNIYNEQSLPLAIDLPPHCFEMCDGCNHDHPSSPILYGQPIRDDLQSIEFPFGNGWDEAELGTGPMLDLLARGFEEECYDNDVQKHEGISDRDNASVDSIEISEYNLFKEFEDLICGHNEPEKSKMKIKSIKEKMNFFEISMKNVMEKQEAIDKKLIEITQVQKKLLELMKQQTDHENEKTEIQMEDCFNVIKGNRWRKAEVDTLIRFRTGLEKNFQYPGTKYHLWKEISNRMYSIGYNRTAKKCKEKWDNINKYYKKAIENKNERPKKSSRCSYFHDLALFYNEDGDDQAMSNRGLEIEDNANEANSASNSIASEMENSFCDSIS
ncbi:hypothetical protein J5N97_026463 [Dioscorea zingiberensis]|uniref:Myb-like domain-containing protein n=1 Tax=Dioscorea zingiberensis TaxID=325984 RepID=A0A9D5H6T3_9LILI|nr:hypothetical protein J5N97_026463 [Dioscorea zingiberensis]